MTKNKATRVKNILKSLGYKMVETDTYSNVNTRWPARNGYLVKPLTERDEWFVEVSGFLNGIVPHSVWKGERNEDIGSRNFYGWESNNGQIETSYQIAARATTFLNNLKEAMK